MLIRRSSAHKQEKTNCIAVWYSSISSGRSEQAKDLESHFNFWMINSDRPRFYKKWVQRQAKIDCFLDIGLMIDPAVDSSHINVFIPGQLKKSNIEDIGQVFKGKSDLVSAVFNEDYRVSASARDKTLVVQKSDMKQVFGIYMLDLENDVVIDSQFDGSVVRIRIPEHLKGQKHYYRIRLKCSFVDRICYNYKPPASRFLKGAFFQTELLDFRLNDKRNLSLSLLEEISKNGEVSLTKTHFFLMREASDDYIFSHEQPIGRQLEKGHWTTYVGKDYSFEKVTAYHWKNAKTHDNFCVFAKFRSFHCSVKTILIAILIILAFGVVGGFLGNCLYSLIK